MQIHLENEMQHKLEEMFLKRMSVISESSLPESSDFVDDDQIFEQVDHEEPKNQRG